MSSFNERPVIFDCHGQQLAGILHPGAEDAETGLVIVVGGPQYRVGSHRQFIGIARHLAAAGIPVLRFDYRGMGDSEGDIRDFQAVGEDIERAIDTLFAEIPGMRQCFLWGLCDAATAIAFHAHRDPRVSGQILLNPWVHTEAGEARAFLKHYYLKRLFSPALWKKILGGGFNLRESASSLGDNIQTAKVQPETRADGALPERMLAGVQAFSGDTLLILSGDDLVASEFLDATAKSREWREWLNSDRLTRHDLAEADHTFSSEKWKNAVADITREWLLDKR